MNERIALKYACALQSHVIPQADNVEQSPVIPSFENKLGTVPQVFPRLENKIRIRMMIILESDAGILGKKKSEFSYQESNLRPSDY